MKYALLISRIIFGLVFIFSGFVKAVDPLGFAYKLDDYFVAFGTDWMMPLSLPISILVNAAEMLVGFAILLGIKMRISAWGGLLFMAFFTPLTLYIAIFNPVTDCGCFGDAIKISNWGTFYKNILFMALAVFIFLNRKKVKPLWSEKKDWYLLLAGGLAGIILAVYCLRNLPLIDFRPWKVGNNVVELMQGEPEEAEFFLVFENNQTGELAEYPASNYPWDDEEWNQKWRFKDQRAKIIKPGKPAPIEGFMINDQMSNDITEELLMDPDYYFVLVAYDLQKANKNSLKRRIMPLANDALQNGLYFFVLTSSPWSVVDQFRQDHDVDYSIYQADDKNLQTIIRSNPGLLLMKEGVVIAKWAHRNIPDFEKIKRNHIN
jgi:uncharacterized membrane protein YphA (DoxX/SURF4 family)